MNFSYLFSVILIVCGLSQSAYSVELSPEFLNLKTPRESLLFTLKAIGDRRFVLSCKTPDHKEEYLVHVYGPYGSKDLYFTSAYEKSGWNAGTELELLNIDGPLIYTDNIYRSNTVFEFLGNGVSPGQLSCEMWTGAY